MIFGDKRIFAIDSSSSEFFPERGRMALGYFNIIIMGHRHGVYSTDATLLSCSYDAVVGRISKAGNHKTILQEGFDCIGFVSVYRKIKYGVIEDFTPLNIAEIDLIHDVECNELLWAPDGDEAFDDGSHVFQIDLGDDVRIISFNNNYSGLEFRKSVLDISITAQSYYNTLKEWSSWFYEEWEAKV